MLARLPFGISRVLLGAQALISLAFCCLAAYGQGDLEAGISCYESKNWKSALAHFQKTLKEVPTDYTALYYSALIYHRMGALQLAKVAYGKLIELYPNSDAARNAVAALNYIDPKYLAKYLPKTQGQSQAAASASSYARGAGGQRRGQPQFVAASDMDKLPEECQIVFEPSGNNLMVDAYVNNRPVKMIFDTGAEGIVFGKNNLQELGIPAPEGAPVGKSRGVGSGGEQQVWMTMATVKVGQIERKNCPILVQEYMPTMPLLGQTFFKDFYYSIQKGQGEIGSGSIRFRKRSQTTSAASANDPSAVHFGKEGNEIVVPVEINGKTIAMYFDTGAEHCVFNEAQLRQLGIEVPDEAQESMSMGIAGTTRTRNFTVPRMRLGPIEKKDVRVSLVDDYHMPHPLLGQTFFGDLRYEFDNEAHLLRIRR